MSRPPPLNVAGRPRAFFGRRSGKRLHAGQDRLYREVLPGLAIELPDAGPLDLDAMFPGRPRRVIEIGYGGGEHLVRQALRHPGTGHVGCEVFSGGIAKLVAAVEAEGIGNIRVFTDDALKLLERLPEAALDGAFLLYPDPWPKTRHHKRRFVSPLTLSELARVLKPGSTLAVATDIEDYANWTLAHVLREPRFAFAPGSWHTPFEDWVPTRYEAKARAEGRTRSFYLTFVRAGDGYRSGTGVSPSAKPR
jgi:tRNA (guanine-N7-)-methyltransferase